MPIEVAITIVGLFCAAVVTGGVLLYLEMR